EVLWRSGARTTVTNVSPNTLLEIPEPETKPGSNAIPRALTAAAGLFEDVSGRVSHRHVENVFDDFGRLPLLPNRLSQLGPALAWQDMDGDGWEDLIIGSGRGGSLAILHNDAQGGFRAPAPVEGKGGSGQGFEQLEQRDLGGILGLRLGGAGNGAELVVVRQSYEDGASNGVSVLFRKSGATETVLADGQDSLGALAAADIDADGDLDLFVGGRCRADRYPSAASSVLL